MMKRTILQISLLYLGTSLGTQAMESGKEDIKEAQSLTTSILKPKEALSQNFPSSILLSSSKKEAAPQVAEDRMVTYLSYFKENA